jgi:hypothetical protein
MNSAMLKRGRGRLTRVSAGMVMALIGVISIALAGCDRELSGVYHQVDGWGRLEFQNHRVLVTVAVVQSTFVAPYELVDDTLIINGPGGAARYTLHADGTIEDANGLRYRTSSSPARR